MASATNATVDIRRLSREDYDRLVERGFFHPEERLELVDGVIFGMTPQSSRHATAVRLVQLALQNVYGDGFDVRSQVPLALGDDSEPEPDVAVVRGHPNDYAAAHPTTALLIVEVADRSIHHDRRRKAALYARSGVPEYWLLDLVKGCLEVHREPRDGAYRSRAVLREGDTVSPWTHPAATLPVASLLPRLPAVTK
jgi:Uma2 family endonuclease